MTSNAPVGNRNGSQQVPFQQENMQGINPAALSQLFQQLKALSGSLSTNTTRKQESPTIPFNQVLLNQLQLAASGLDTNGLFQSYTQNSSEKDGSSLSPHFINAQFLSLLSAALQKPAVAINTSMSNGPMSSNPSLLVNLPFGTEQRKSSATASSYGTEDSISNEDNLLSSLAQSPDLQKLLVTLASSTCQNNTTQAGYQVPNFPAIAQSLTSILQQQSQTSRANSVLSNVSVSPTESSSPSPSSVLNQSTATSTLRTTPASSDPSQLAHSTASMFPWMTSSGSGDCVASNDVGRPYQVQSTQKSQAATPTQTSSNRPRQQRFPANMRKDEDGFGVNLIASKSQSNKNIPISLLQMQNWTLEQLEKHVQVLRETNQPIPQAVSLLLSEARRKDEKRNAKRVANRKSACTSRARKKALVEEMTRTNELLKRQALILSLLPDLVMTITVDGEITFCSDQVERVLHHKVDDLLGADINEILIPASREALMRLTKKLVSAAEQAEASSGSGSSDVEGIGGAEAAVVSEPSDGSLSKKTFPLSEVNVKNYNRQLLLNEQALRANIGHGGVDNGNNSNGIDKTTTSSLTNSDLAQSNNGNSRKNSDDESDQKLNNALNHQEARSQESSTSTKPLEPTSGRRDALSRHGDDSMSSLSAENCKGLQLGYTASIHPIACTQIESQRSQTFPKALESKGEHRQTDSQASNSGMRRGGTGTGNKKTLDEQLSSSSSESSVEHEMLKRRRAVPESENYSDDSGYRESGESEPSESDGSNGKVGTRQRPLAPTCNVCLIRKDLTTIWCEITSSIHSANITDDRSVSLSSTKATGNKSTALKVNKNETGFSLKDCEVEPQIIVRKELLLCLRPIRDGTEKVSEDLRFRSLSKVKKDHDHFQDKTEQLCDQGISSNQGNNSAKCKGYAVQTSSGDFSKKRPYAVTESGDSEKASLSKVTIVKERPTEAADAEKTVAESLMLMSAYQ